MKLYPDGAKVYNSLGNFYRRLGRYEEAITQYKKALAIVPYYPTAHYNLGLTYGVRYFKSIDLN